MFVKSEYKEILDENNQIIIEIDVAIDHSSIRAFSVIYISKIQEKEVIIIKFDADERESFHVHNYFYHKEIKKYFQKPINWNTMDDCIEQIKQNWRWYLSQYKENHYI